MLHFSTSWGGLCRTAAKGREDGGVESGGEGSCTVPLPRYKKRYTQSEAQTCSLAQGHTARRATDTGTLDRHSDTHPPTPAQQTRMPGPGPWPYGPRTPSASQKPPSCQPGPPGPPLRRSGGGGPAAGERGSWLPAVWSGVRLSGATRWPREAATQGLCGSQSPCLCPCVSQAVLFFVLFFFAVLELELGLYLEPLHQPFFVKDFFQDRVS
jgi:hypothetical protein